MKEYLDLSFLSVGHFALVVFSLGTAVIIAYRLIIHLLSFFAKTMDIYLTYRLLRKNGYPPEGFHLDTLTTEELKTKKGFEPNIYVLLKNATTKQIFWTKSSHQHPPGFEIIYSGSTIKEMIHEYEKAILKQAE